MANYRPRSLSDINNSYDNERRAEKAIKNKTEKIEPTVHKPTSPFLTPPDSFIIPAEVEKEKEKVFSDISGDVDELIREFSKPQPKKKAVKTERPLHGVKPVEQPQYSSMRRKEGAPKIVSTADPNRKTRQTVASLAQKAARKDDRKDASSYYRQPRPEKNAPAQSAPKARQSAEPTPPPISVPEHKAATRDSFAMPERKDEKISALEKTQSAEPAFTEPVSSVPPVSTSTKPVTDSRFDDLISDYVKVMNDHDDYRDDEEEKSGDRRSIFRKRKNKKSAQSIIPESENETRYIPEEDFSSDSAFASSLFGSDASEKNEQYAQPSGNESVPQAEIFDEQENVVEQEELVSPVVTEPIEEESVESFESFRPQKNEESPVEMQVDSHEESDSEDYVFDFENMIPSAAPQSEMNVVYSLEQDEENSQDEPLDTEEELFSDLFEDEQLPEEKPKKKKKNKKSKKQLKKEKRAQKALEASQKEQDENPVLSSQPEEDEAFEQPVQSFDDEPEEEDELQSDFAEALDDSLKEQKEPSKKELKRENKKGIRVFVGIIFVLCVLATAAVSSLSAVFHVNKAVPGPMGVYCFTSSSDYSNVGVYAGDFVVCKPISSDSAQEAVAIVDKENNKFSFGIKNETVEAEDGKTYCIIDGQAVEKSNVAGKIALTVPKLGTITDIVFSSFASVVVSLFVLCVVLLLLLVFLSKGSGKKVIREKPPEEPVEEFSEEVDQDYDGPLPFDDELETEEQGSTDIDDDDDIYTGQYVDQSEQDENDEKAPEDEYGSFEPNSGEAEDDDPFSDL